MDVLTKCVVALKDVRRELHGRIDPGIGLALDAVIADLEGWMRKPDGNEAELMRTWAKALELLSYILSCCSSVADLIGRLNS